MKTLLLSWVGILMLAAATLPAAESDFRFIDGNKVDVGPVQAWMKTHQGQRPLAAWRMLSIMRMSAKVGLCYLCGVQIEGGGEATILLAGLAPSLAAQASHSAPGTVNELALPTGKVFEGHAIWDCGYDARDERLRAVTPELENAASKRLAEAGKAPATPGQRRTADMAGRAAENIDSFYRGMGLDLPTIISQAMRDDEMGRQNWIVQQELKQAQAAAELDRQILSVEPAIRQTRQDASTPSAWNKEPSPATSTRRLATDIFKQGTSDQFPAPVDTTFYHFPGPGPIKTGTIDRFGNTRFYSFSGPAGRIRGTSDSMFGTTFYELHGPAGTVRGTSDNLGDLTFYDFLAPSGPSRGMSYSLGGVRFFDSLGTATATRSMSYDLGGSKFHDSWCLVRGVKP